VLRYRQKRLLASTREPAGANQRNGEARDAQLHQSDRGTPPDQAQPDGNDSLYRFNFLTQRDFKVRFLEYHWTVNHRKWAYVR
jgi:hypothetical protein